MHSHYFRLVGVGLGALWLNLSLGVNACSSVEVCDGIDNDLDGEIDEGFDQDLDGHPSAEACPAGDDCDDTDPAVQPGAPEVQDGIDNDCDGMIDEQTSPYSFTFVGKYSRLPLEGVAVWTGTEGTGPHGVSGADGTVTLELEGPTQDWSFGYHAAYANPSGGSDRDYHRIYTYIRDTLESSQTIELATSFESPPTQSVDLTLTEVAPDPFSPLWIYTNSVSYYLEPTLDTLTATVSQRLDEESFLFAGQFPPCTEDSCSNIPERFGALRNLNSSTSLALDKSFDQSVSLVWRNVDPGMTTAMQMLELGMTSSDSVWFDTGELDLSEPGSRIAPIPELTGALSGADLLICTYLHNDKGGQEMDFPWTSGSGTMTVSLPPVLVVSDDYPPLSLETLSGTTIDYYQDAGADYEALDYYLYQYAYNAAGKRVLYGNTWHVTSKDPSGALTFATIPSGLFSFVPPENPYSEILLTGAAAAYGYYDEDPVVKWGTAELTLADSATSARGTQPLEVHSSSLRASDRQALELEAPVIHR